MKSPGIRNRAFQLLALLQLASFGAADHAFAVNDEPCPNAEIVQAPFLDQAPEPSVIAVNTSTGRTVTVVWNMPANPIGLFRCAALDPEPFEGRISLNGPAVETFHNLHEDDQIILSRTYTAYYKSPLEASPVDEKCGVVTKTITISGHAVGRTEPNPDAFCDVALGQRHALALRSDGSVWAWGENDFGQLGDGTIEQRGAPVKVIDGGVTAVAAGAFHSMALTADGFVYCWGRNQYSQVGNNSTEDQKTPLKIQGLPAVTAIAGGTAHSLAVSGGQVWEWGFTVHSQTLPFVGPSPVFVIDHVQPVPLMRQDLSGVAGVYGGDYFSAVLKDDGALWGWGSHMYFNPGANFPANSYASTPSRIMPSKTFQSVALGTNALTAVDVDGHIWRTASSGDPYVIPGMEGMSAVVGDELPFAVNRNGSLYSFRTATGFWTSAGTLNVNKWGGDEYIDVASNANVTLAVTRKGILHSWGAAASLLGEGVRSGSRDFSQLYGPENIRTISHASPAVADAVPASAFDTHYGAFIAIGPRGHTVAVDGDGRVWTAGDNSYGQLGFGDFVPRSRFSRVETLSGVESGVAFGSKSAVVKEDGTVWVWGSNSGSIFLNGLPTNTDQCSPRKVDALADVAEMAATSGRCLVLTHGGQLLEFKGELSPSSVFTPVAGNITGISSIAVGLECGMALTENGELWAWGQPQHWQLGPGFEWVDVPQVIAEDIHQVALGDTSVMVIKNDRSLWFWGDLYNEMIYGPGGYGPAYPGGTSVRTKILDKVEHVAAGRFFGMAIKQDGTVWAWGSNQYGQLPVSTAGRVATPTMIASGIDPSSKGVAGFDARFILKQDGGLLIAGNGDNGSLGTAAGLAPFHRQVAGLNLLAAPTPVIAASMAGSSNPLIGEIRDIRIGSTGSIPLQKVAFYADGILLSEVAAAPFTYRYTAKSWGRMNIRVVATDAEGNTSSPVVISLDTPYSSSGYTADSDGDGLPDEWEIAYFGNLSHAGDEDTDADGLNNLGEFERGTSPDNSDTDGDGIPDGSDTNPLVNDWAGPLRVHYIEVVTPYE